MLLSGDISKIRHRVWFSILGVFFLSFFFDGDDVELRNKDFFLGQGGSCYKLSFSGP